MEQSGVSIIAPPGITDNSVGKSKSIGITFRTNPTIQAAKEKLKTPWLSSLMQEDATGWETLMFGLGEVIGTAILVFIGCAGCIGSMDSVPSNLQISLTFGFAVMIAIQCVGHISGAHLNPAITVAAVILGKKSLPMAALYTCAQCVGSLLGYGLLKLITPSTLLYSTSLAKAGSFCTTDVYHGLKANQGFLVEILATAVLVLFACGLWDYRNVKNTDSVSIRFGLCIAVLCMVFIPYTGSSMNPARSLGPAVWNGYWDNHWIYWVGPICGAIVAALLYRCLFLCKRNPERQSNGNLRGVET